MRYHALATCLTALLAFPAGARAELPADQAESVVNKALFSVVDIPQQADTLVGLAWTDPGTDPAVRAVARRRLGEYGQHALPSLLRAMSRVTRDQTAEVARVVLAAASRVTGGVAPELVPALEDALWSGSNEARRIAIPELARQRDRFSLLVMIDVAEEDPSLLPVVVPALGELGDDRARFFLAKILVGGKPREAEQAAAALARIGARALEPLREALRSSSPALRLTAARAILPVASENDLSALYEYLAAYPSDDTATSAAIKAACATIEAAAEARRAADAASAPKDF